MNNRNFKPAHKIAQYKFWHNVMNAISVYGGSHTFEFTLTIPSGIHTYGELATANHAIASWAKLTKQFTKIPAIKDWVRVVDFHQSGAAHLHCILFLEPIKNMTIADLIRWRNALYVYALKSGFAPMMTLSPIKTTKERFVNYFANRYGESYKFMQGSYIRLCAYSKGFPKVR